VHVALRAQVTPWAAAKPDGMAALLTVVPVGLVLGLLVFGHYGDREPRPTRPRIAATAAAAVLLGPVAVAELGLFVWLLGIAIVAAGITALAMLRAPEQPLGH